MSPRLDIARTRADFEAIVALQRANHASAVASERHGSEGFVYARHDAELLQRFAAYLPQVIVRDPDGQIVGYTLAMPVQLRDSVPELTPMFTQFERMPYQGRPISQWPYFVGGQVCVAPAWRGKGLLAALYSESARLAGSAMQLCVTEVALRNEVSLRAHHRLGFLPVGRYRDDHEQWEVLAWPLPAASP